MAGSTEMDPMEPVRRFVEAFNQNDVDGMQAACSEATSIIDDFPPHEWTGPRAITAWFHEMVRMAADDDMSDWSVTIGEPRHVVVSDGGAYVSVPADVRWLQDATPSERACLMALSLRQGAEEWQISALAWAWR